MIPVWAVAVGRSKELLEPVVFSEVVVGNPQDYKIHDQCVGSSQQHSDVGLTMSDVGYLMGPAAAVGTVAADNKSREEVGQDDLVVMQQRSRRS